MGSIESSHQRQQYYQPRRGGPHHQVPAEVVNIHLTPDVLERWTMLASAASASSAALSSSSSAEGGGGGEGDHYQKKRDEDKQMIGSRRDEFEDVVNYSKESLRNLTNELMSDKVILGVEKDGKPTFETVGAWKARQEKEEELRKNDRMWNEKLDALKEKYVDSMIEDAEVFFDRVDKLKSEDSCLIPQKKTSSCETLQTQIARCYSANPKEVVQCRPLVMKFYSCVEKFSGADRQP